MQENEKKPDQDVQRDKETGLTVSKCGNRIKDCYTLKLRKEVYVEKPG